MREMGVNNKRRESRAAKYYYLVRAHEIKTRKIMVGIEGHF